MNRQGAAAGTVKLRREGPLVLMTTGAWSPDAAQKIVEGIHLHDVLTWNKTMPLDFQNGNSQDGESADEYRHLFRPPDAVGGGAGFCFWGLEGRRFG